MPDAAPTLSTRDRLIRTAMKLFWEKGYGSTSVADLLQAASVNSGSLYHFFPGKQDVLLAVLDAYRDGIGPMLLAPAWQGVDGPIERVFALLARYRLGIVQTDCGYACPIGSLALEIHEPDPPVRERLGANFKAWTDAIEACLVAAGPRLPRALDRRELARFVLTTMEGGVMQARTHRDVAYFDSSVRQLRLYFDHLEREAADQPPRPKPPRKRPTSRRTK
jgi:TetR/AcrR family transcriptional regulator, transcriptional repressor for nem operon